MDGFTSNLILIFNGEGKGDVSSRCSRVRV